MHELVHISEDVEELGSLMYVVGQNLEAMNIELNTALIATGGDLQKAITLVNSRSAAYGWGLMGPYDSDPHAALQRHDVAPAVLVPAAEEVTDAVRTWAEGQAAATAPRSAAFGRRDAAVPTYDVVGNAGGGGGGRVRVAAARAVAAVGACRCALHAPPAGV